MTDISLRADVLLKGQKGMKKGNKQLKFFLFFPSLLVLQRGSKQLVGE